MFPYQQQIHLYLKHARCLCRGAGGCSVSEAAGRSSTSTASLASTKSDSAALDAPYALHARSPGCPQPWMPLSGYPPPCNPYSHTPYAQAQGRVGLAGRALLSARLRPGRRRLAAQHAMRLPHAPRHRVPPRTSGQPRTASSRGRAARLRT